MGSITIFQGKSVALFFFGLVSIVMAASIPVRAAAEILHVCLGPDGQPTNGWVCPQVEEIFPSTASIAPPGRSYADNVPTTLDLAEWAKEYYHGALSLMVPGASINHYWQNLGGGVWVPDYAYTPGLRRVYYPITIPAEGVDIDDWCTDVNPPCIDGRGVPQWAIHLQAIRRAREMIGNDVSAADQQRELMSLRGIIAYDQHNSGNGSPGRVPGGTTYGYSTMLLGDLYRQLSSPRIKRVVDEYVRWENAMMGSDGTFSYWYNIRSDQTGEGTDGRGGYHNNNMHRVAFQAYWGAPLSAWYLLTGSQTAFDLGKKASNYLLNYQNGEFWRNPDPSRFQADPPIAYVGQLLAYPPAAAALLEDARARLKANPQDPVARQNVIKAKDVYEFTKRRADMGLLGTFGTVSTLGVMLQMATYFEEMRTVYPDLIPFSSYYEEAERWVRNSAAEARIDATVASHIANGASGDPRTDSIASRARGTFFSDITHPISLPLNTFMDNDDGLWLQRGLYDVWKNTVTVSEVNGTTVAWVNFLLNNASQYMDVYSDIPYRGRVVVDMRNDIGPIQSIAIRIPSWTRDGEVRVFENTGSGDQQLSQHSRWAWNDRYIVINGIRAGAEYTVRFPMTVQRKTITQRHSQEQWWSESPYGGNGFPETVTTYNGTFLGDTLVDVDSRPSGGIQRYQRSGLAALINGNTVNEVAPPQRGVTRFVFQPRTDAPGPTVSLTVNNAASHVSNGQPYTLRWSSSNATHCTLTARPAGGQPQDQNIDPNTSGNAPGTLVGSWKFKCISADGEDAEAAVTITGAAAAPAVTLAISGQQAHQVPLGETYTMDYSTSNVTSCRLSWQGTGPHASQSGATDLEASQLNTSGTAPSNLIGSYTLTCQGAGGQSATQTVTVTARPGSGAPAVSMTVNGGATHAIPLGGEYAVAYSTANVTSCRMSWQGTGPHAAQVGSTELAANQLNTSGSTQSGLIGSYTLSCRGQDGTDLSRTITVTQVAQTPAVTFTINGQAVHQITLGEEYTVAYATTNVASCRMSWQGSGPHAAQVGSTDLAASQLNTSGTTRSGLVGSYTLTCVGLNGQNLSRTLTIEGIQVPTTPTVTMTINGAQTHAVPPGGEYDIAYASTNVTSCSMSYQGTGPHAALGGGHSVPANTTGTARSGLVGSYTLSCIGTNGQTVTKTVTTTETAASNNVRVSLAVNDRSAIGIPPNSPFTLTYFSANAASCSLVYQIGNAAPITNNVAPNTSGSSDGGVLNEGIVYTMTCDGTNGSKVSRVARVFIGEIPASTQSDDAVAAPAIASFSGGTRTASADNSASMSAPRIAKLIAGATSGLSPRIAKLTGGSASPQTVRIAQLTGGTRSSATPSSSNACLALTRTLSFGSRGTDVTRLQKYLMSHGFLAAGNDSGYFGRLTEAAVKAWQAKNGIVSSGTPSTTGYGAVGPKTRAALNKCN